MFDGQKDKEFNKQWQIFCINQNQRTMDTIQTTLDCMLFICGLSFFIYSIVFHNSILFYLSISIISFIIIGEAISLILYKKDLKNIIDVTSRQRSIDILDKIININNYFGLALVFISFITLIYVKI